MLVLEENGRIFWWIVYHVYMVCYTFSGFFWYVIRPWNKKKKEKKFIYLKKKKKKKKNKKNKKNKRLLVAYSWLGRVINSLQ